MEERYESKKVSVLAFIPDLLTVITHTVSFLSGHFLSDSHHLLCGGDKERALSQLPPCCFLLSFLLGDHSFRIWRFELKNRL